MRPVDIAPLFVAVLHVFIVPVLAGCNEPGANAFKNDTRESIRACENRDLDPGMRYVDYYPPYTNRDRWKCKNNRLDRDCYKCRILHDTPPDVYNEQGEKIAYTAHCKDNCCVLRLDEQSGCPPEDTKIPEARGGLVEYVCIYWEKRNEVWSWYCYVVEISCHKKFLYEYFENHTRHLTLDEDNKPEAPIIPTPRVPRPDWPPKWQEFVPPCRLDRHIMVRSGRYWCVGRDYYIWDMQDGKVMLGTSTTTSTSTTTTTTPSTSTTTTTPTTATTTATTPTTTTTTSSTTTTTLPTTTTTLPTTTTTPSTTTTTTTPTTTTTTTAPTTTTTTTPTTTTTTTTATPSTTTTKRAAPETTTTTASPTTTTTTTTSTSSPPTTTSSTTTSSTTTSLSDVSNAAGGSPRKQVDRAGESDCNWLVLFFIFAVLALLVSVFFIVIIVIGEAGRRRHRRRTRENTLEEARTPKSASARRRKGKPAKYHDEGTQSDITSDVSTNLQTPTQESHAYFQPPQAANDPQESSANYAPAKEHFGHQTP